MDSKKATDYRWYARNLMYAIGNVNDVQKKVGESNPMDPVIEDINKAKAHLCDALSQLISTADSLDSRHFDGSSYSKEGNDEPIG